MTIANRAYHSSSPEDFSSSSPGAFSSGSSSGSCTDEENRQSRTTIYERIRAIYSRDVNSLLSIRTFGWDIPVDFVCRITTDESTQIENCVHGRIVDNTHTAVDYERGNGIWVGVVVSGLQEINDFDFWFLRLLAGSGKSDYCGSIENNNTNTSKEVTRLFANELKNTTKDDQWEGFGEEYFEKTVDFFVKRNVPIEAVLPAFPHKSSNLDKVSSPMPDKGEELALRRLVSFAASVKQIYSPGIQIWIVSDGHVFSDCGMYILI